MTTPTSFQPQIGDVLLVRATISRVTRGAEGEHAKIAARTESGHLVRCIGADIEKVEAFTIRVGTRVRWWEDGTHHAGNTIMPAGWHYGEVLGIEPAADEGDQPHKDNLWIKDETRWPRLTKQRKEVERA